MGTNSDTSLASNSSQSGISGVGSFIANIFGGLVAGDNVATETGATSVATTATNATSVSNVTAATTLAGLQNQDTNTTAQYVQYNDLSISEQDMIVNVTREYPFHYATIMFGYIMPFVLILTLITNTLVVMVLAQKHMRTPTNIVLFTMAIVDLMTLLSPSPWYFYIYTLGYHDKFLYPPIACYAHHIMTDVIPVFFHTSSIWLALLLASQRYIYVCHPTLARTWCTVPRVKRAIIVILVIAFLHQFSRFFDVTFAPVHIQYDQGHQDACKISISEWVQEIDIAMYYISYYIFRILFVLIIPCTALITLNYLLFRALKRAEDKRTRLLTTRFNFFGGHYRYAKRKDQDPSFAPNEVSKDAHTEPAANDISGDNIGLANASCQSARIPTRAERTRAALMRRRRSKLKNKFSLAELLGKKTKYGTDNAPSQDADGQLSELVANQPLSEISTNNRSEVLVDEETINKQAQSAPSNEQVEKSPRKKKKLSSAETSVSCSVSTNQSKEISGEADGEKTRGARKDEPISRPQVGVNKSVSLDSNNPCCNQEISTCAECAAYGQNPVLACRRCATSANDGATEDRDETTHQAVSQCSSLMGGATNTTTNEDISSCLATQNASSCMYATHDETLEAIETGSMRGDCIEDIEIDQENLSLQNSKSLLTKAKLNEHARPKLSKSGSIDSRLACGCAYSNKTPGATLRRMRLTRQKQPCPECCQFQPDTKELDQSASSCGQHTVKDHKCMASCSNSDPCVNCFNSNCSSKKDVDDICAGEQAPLIKQVIPSSQSDYGNKANCDTTAKQLYSAKLNGLEIIAKTAIATATTTTTTLNSNTNSVGSLLQVQNFAAPSGSKRQGIQLTRIKSPSFASSIARGSRATISGGPNPIPVVVTGEKNTSSVSTRSNIDSNRTTLMLIVVVTVFLMVEVPVAIVTILHVVLNTFDVFGDVELHASLNYIKLFTNFFIMISYSVNFTIYCSMSKKFRETFRDLFLCGSQSRRQRSKSFLYQQSQYNPHPSNNQLIPSNVSPAFGQIQNDFNTTITGLNYNNGAMRLPNQRRANSQQPECEL